MASDDLVRLNALMARCGVCSRREADRLIEAGKVLVNGQPAVTGQKVYGTDLVTVDGAVLVRSDERVVYALYKPVGYVCTTDERWGDKLVGSLIPSENRLIYMGRLDKNSEGLILMTNDGSFSDEIMRGRNMHEKEYEVRVDKKIDEAFLKRMREGIYLKELGVRTRACRVTKTGERSFSIILTQGLNRQIRRMCDACGYEVVSLKRVRIMSISLGDLKPGEYRKLREDEILALS